MRVRGKSESSLDDGVLMGGEVFVAFLRTDREGHEGGQMVDGLGGRLGVGRADFDRSHADGGHDLGGFLGGADLRGFEGGDDGLEAFDLLRGGGQGGFKLDDLGVLRRGFELEGFEFRGCADGEFFDGGPEVVALGGDARDGGGGFEELFFDGHGLVIGSIGISGGLAVQLLDLAFGPFGGPHDVAGGRSAP